MGNPYDLGGAAPRQDTVPVCFEPDRVDSAVVLSTSFVVLGTAHDVPKGSHGRNKMNGKLPRLYAPVETELTAVEVWLLNAGSKRICPALAILAARTLNTDGTPDLTTLEVRQGIPILQRR